MNKLELNWIGKEENPSIEPRILIENRNLSNYGPKGKLDNLMIHGDNLLALKALESKFNGKIKCVYIDPPYNTGSAFSTYDDNLEHSTWLSLMRPRIESIYKLLDAEQGSLWISIDDDERDYLKVLCDEIFGRINFVASVIWQKKGTRSNDAKWFSDNHDYVLVYAKNKLKWKLNRLPRPEGSEKGYSNPDNDPRGPWASGPCHAKTPNEKDIYEIITPSGKKVMPPAGTSWRFSKDRFKELIVDNHIWFGPNGGNVPRYKRFLSEVEGKGFVPLTIWTRDEVGDNQEAKKEVKTFNSKIVFATPKPERLIQRILQIATEENDYILDSFLGSGTTAAVAHKMKRKWIGIEMTDSIYLHCKPRLDKVISGEDINGISKNVKWVSGGDYVFYELAPSLIKTDSFGQEVINPEYNAEMLSSAVAIHEGYRFNPDKNIYWKQASNGENSYLFVTTKHIDKTIIDSIVTEMSENEFLLIVCKSFDSNSTVGIKNISIKKIPQSLMTNCEFSVDNYNLNIVCPPTYVEEDEENE